MFDRYQCPVAASLMITVHLILPAAESYLPGDFVVHRALPRRELRRVGGFVFLDHFDQPNVTPELFDVPPHPHVGLQTVTYLFEGEILHTDSLDYQQKIRPGDVNWMTSGRGITHAEQVTELLPQIHGVQSWVGLPHDKRKVEPGFEHFDKAVLPVIESGGAAITVLAGECGGKRSPIPTFQELTYLDIKTSAAVNTRISVDPEQELAVYICEGAIDINGTALKRHDLARLSSGDTFAFSTSNSSRFVLLGGEPLPEPTTIYWNFITDTIGEAKARMIEWEEGKFPPVQKYRKISSSIEEEPREKMTLL